MSLFAIYSRKTIVRSDLIPAFCRMLMEANKLLGVLLDLCFATFRQHWKFARQYLGNFTNVHHDDLPIACNHLYFASPPSHPLPPISVPSALHFILPLLLLYDTVCHTLHPTANYHLSVAWVWLMPTSLVQLSSTPLQSLKRGPDWERCLSIPSIDAA